MDDEVLTRHDFERWYLVQVQPNTDVGSYGKFPQRIFRDKIDPGRSIVHEELRFPGRVIASLEERAVELSLQLVAMPQSAEVALECSQLIRHALEKMAAAREILVDSNVRSGALERHAALFKARDHMEIAHSLSMDTLKILDRQEFEEKTIRGRTSQLISHSATSVKKLDKLMQRWEEEE